MIIVDRDGELETFNILCQHISRKGQKDYSVWVLVSNPRDPDTSILYARGPINSILKKLKYSEKKDPEILQLLEQDEENYGYKFMYARRNLDEKETRNVKKELQNLYSQLIIDQQAQEAILSKF